MSRIGSKPKAAFTLVELLVAVAILAIGLIGILRAYVVLINGLEAAKYGMETALLAEEKMIDLEKYMLENGDIAAGASGGRFETELGLFEWELQVDAMEIETAETDEAAETGETAETDEPEDGPKGSLSRILLNVRTQTNIKPPRKVTLAAYVEDIE